MIPAISGAEPLRLEVEDFIRGIQSGVAVRADAESGLRVVKALQAASRSLSENGRVEHLRPSATPEYQHAIGYDGGRAHSTAQSAAR